jgi:hypothetical protein
LKRKTFSLAVIQSKSGVSLMRSIVRKRLVALLSLAGFAGSNGSATAQVVKGTNATTTTKSESVVKTQKNVQENHAGAAQVGVKRQKTGASQYPIEHGKEASLNNHKTSTYVKGSKNTSESNAANGAANKKAKKGSSGKTGTSGSGGQNKPS